MVIVRPLYLMKKKIKIIINFLGGGVHPNQQRSRLYTQRHSQIYMRFRIDYWRLRLPLHLPSPPTPTTPTPSTAPPPRLITPDPAVPTHTPVKGRDQATHSTSSYLKLNSGTRHESRGKRVVWGVIARGVAYSAAPSRVGDAGEGGAGSGGVRGLTNLWFSRSAPASIGGVNTHTRASVGSFTPHTGGGGGRAGYTHHARIHRCFSWNVGVGFERLNEVSYHYLRSPRPSPLSPSHPHSSPLARPSVVSCCAISKRHTFDIHFAR